MLQKIDHILKGRAAWLALAMIFLFRLAYGLCSEFWFDDELQVYLIGLKFYTSGQFPLLGPDVVYTFTQIPGSLQGLLVGLPFYVWQAPEAPYILLNLMSTATLGLLAHYITKRLPTLPVAITWLWVLTCPWAMNYSTHILNPSYVLPAAILFFIAFMESVPRLKIGFMKPGPAFFLMGFSLMWIFQLHLSWVLLIPFIGFAWILLLREGFMKSLRLTLLLFLGALLPSLLLIPAILEFGWAGTFAQTADNLVLNWKNLGSFFTILTRFLSLASFESSRFLGTNTSERLSFLSDYLWFSPFIVFAAIVGLVQPLWMLVAPFLKKTNPHMKLLRWILLAAFILIWLSFLFSVKGPASHTFYLMLPLIMIYSFYCWDRILHKKWIRTITVVFLLCGLIFNATVMHYNYHHKSMYLNRDKVVKAIQLKDYHQLGERRSFDRNP